MLFAGKTKSGSHHLWPRWWVFLFGGNFSQKNGGYGRCYSILSRIRRYYREGWHTHYSLTKWIWHQGPYGLCYFQHGLKNQCEITKISDDAKVDNVFYLDCFISSSTFPVNTYYDEDPKKLAEVGASLLLRNMSGITSITISKETLGMSPIKLRS